MDWKLPDDKIFDPSFPEAPVSKTIESLPFKSIQHLKDSLCRWLDDTVEKLGGEREVSSNVDDDGKLHLMVHDVVMTNPEDTGDEQHYYMTIEQVDWKGVSNVWEEYSFI